MSFFSIFESKFNLKVDKKYTLDQWTLINKIEEIEHKTEKKHILLYLSRSFENVKMFKSLKIMSN